MTDREQFIECCFYFGYGMVTCALIVWGLFASARKPR